MFIQNFWVLRQTVWFQYLFEIKGNLAKFCWKIAFFRTFSSINSYISVKVELNLTEFLYLDGSLLWFWIALDFSPFSEKKFAHINRLYDKNPVQPLKIREKLDFSLKNKFIHSFFFLIHKLRLIFIFQNQSCHFCLIHTEMRLI